MSLKIITTEDGSQSLYDDQLNETYHSTKGARGESVYVFLKQGLDFYSERFGRHDLRVLEIGFGTGLNAWLTKNRADDRKLHISYRTLEPFPVQKDIWSNLELGQDEVFYALHNAKWNSEISFGDYFHFLKMQQPLQKFESEEKFHVIFFDAFAPSKQPDIWEIENLRKCYDLLEPGGILTTYCAQGQFKRNLAAVGFEVQVLPGAMGKKEMVRGSKEG
jgi:tRNA U34 5-methylaminomethyl-2-thiouridine-forming methyltransferase MnmC